MKSIDNKCWLAVFPSEGADVRQWGVLFDGATDNSTALQSALTWAALGNKLLLPSSSSCANFATGITATLANAQVAMTIEGAGTDVSCLNYTTNSGTAIRVTYSSLFNSTHWRNFSLTTSQAGGNTGIFLTTTATKGTAKFAQSDMEGVSLHGNDGGLSTNYFLTNLNFNGVDNFNLSRVLIYGPGSQSGNGIVTGASVPSYVYNLHNVIISSVATAFIYGDQVQGVTINQSNFEASGANIYVPATSTALAELNVSDSQFVGGVGIRSAACMYQLIVIGNVFYIPNAVNGIQLENDCGSQIIGNTLQTSGSIGQGTGIAITTTQATTPPTLISGNDFYRLNTGVNLAAGATGITLASNGWMQNTTDFVNSGSGNNIGTPSTLLIGSAQVGLVAGTTNYCGIGCSAAEGNAEFPLPAKSVLDRLTVFGSAAPGGAAVNTFTVRCAGSDTALTTAHSSGVSFNQDTTHSVIAVNGAVCDLKAVIGGGSAVNSYQASLRIGANY